MFSAEHLTVYETLVRADFLVAVALLVVAPLILLVGAARTPPVRDRLLVYWRASALLGITVYLWAGSVQVGFVTGYLARAIIPLALWRGDALHPLGQRLYPDASDRLARAYRWWCRAAIAYNVMGLIYMLPLLSCAVGSDASAMCGAWYEPPQILTGTLHPDVSPLWLGRYGWLGLGAYAAYLLATASVLRHHRPASSV